LIVDRGLKEIKPKIGPNGVTYKGLDILVEKEGFDWRRMRRLLESMAEKGFLTPSGYERALTCNICGSPHVYSEYSCPKCESIDVSRMRLIEHPFCGYTGLWNVFVRSTRLVCPNCKTDLGPSNGRPKGDGSKSDYRMIGSSFQCEKCKYRFDRPNVVHKCQNCDSTFTYKTSRYEKIFTYNIPDDVIRRLREVEETSVLVVEDNEDDAEIVKMNLQRSSDKITVDHVLIGEKGLEKIGEKIYDIILLDFNLPDMNGVEFLKELRQRKIDTPVIVFTGADDREIAVASMKLGAIDYIVKSVEVYERLPSIVKQIRKNKVLLN